jgi:two-component system, chemotaxis family, CheB/CheR fusion protein
LDKAGASARVDIIIDVPGGTGILLCFRGFKMEQVKDGACEPDALKLVVGVGASAGGLEVLEDFLKAMPADAGVALVVVQHLSPDHRSHMVALLAKHTSMPVCSAEDGMRLTPNAIFLIPPKKVLTVSGGALRLAERGAGLVLPVDILFRSIAEEYRERSAGIVLSGTGSDGMRGVRAIKEVGGLVLVQDPATAKFDGMPRAAAASGVADFIVPVRELPEKLVGYVAHSHELTSREADAGGVHEGSAMDNIFGIVRRQTAVDFSSYKPSTIQRRIQRRMAITQSPTIDDYLNLIERSTQEVSALFREFLISVTRFFRDPDVFEQVRRDVIPALVEKTRPGESIRVWVPGCSTGEEAYSLAMLFEEHFESGGRPRDVKVFATDIDATALEVAGAGLYHDSIAADVSPERLSRFFTRRGEAYQVARFLRQRVVFANHDLTRDPPFSRVSMVSCRNLLIYFASPLQARVLTAFRFALRPGGFLLLGSSETAGDVTSELLPVTGTAKLYLRTDAPAVSRERPRPSAAAALGTAEPAPGRVDTRLLPALDALARACAPPTALINEHHEVLHFFGQPTPLVRLGSGAPSLNLLQLLPSSVASILNLATHRALRDSEDVVYGPVQTELGALRLDVRVVAGTGAARQLLVSFALPNADQTSSDQPVAVNVDAQQQIGDLQQELQYSRESLQATIEELETSNEELQATNEELVASNEELQATNEELQSVNEELHSLNAEYQRKIEELVRLNDDVHNLLLSTRIGLIFLDGSLQVARFTSPMTELMNLLPRDVGRPIKDISFKFDATWFNSALQTVLETRQPMDRDHTLADGQTYLLRVAPYVSEIPSGKGLVVTALNVTDARGIEQRLGAVLDALPYQVAVLESNGTIVAVNAEWLRFGSENGDTKPSATGVGANYLAVCRASMAASPDARTVATSLGALLAGTGGDFELEYPCDSGRERRWFLMQARAIPPQGAVVSHLNITRRKVLELEVQASPSNESHPPRAGESAG